MSLSHESPRVTRGRSWGSAGVSPCLDAHWLKELVSGSVDTCGPVCSLGLGMLGGLGVMKAPPPCSGFAHSPS